jgi:hypothetical protein
MKESVPVPENYKQLRHIELLELVQRRTDCRSGQEITIASLSRDALISMLMP